MGALSSLIQYSFALCSPKLSAYLLLWFNRISSWYRPTFHLAHLLLYQLYQDIHRVLLKRLPPYHIIYYRQSKSIHPSKHLFSMVSCLCVLFFLTSYIHFLEVNRETWENFLPFCKKTTHLKLCDYSESINNWCVWWFLYTYPSCWIAASIHCSLPH